MMRTITKMKCNLKKKKRQKEALIYKKITSQRPNIVQNKATHSIFTSNFKDKRLQTSKIKDYLDYKKSFRKKTNK